MNISAPTFLTPNEEGLESTFKSLQKMNKIEKGVHVGVCPGLHNWDYIVAMRSRCAVLLEHNSSAWKFHLKALEILRSSFTPLIFKNELLKELAIHSYDYQNHPRYKESDKMENARQELTDWMQKPYSALHNQVSFSFLRRLAQNHQIIVIPLYIQNFTKIKEVSKIFHRLGLKVSSLYLSNVYDSFCEDEICDDSPEEQDAFKKSITFLKDNDTCIIDSSMHNTASRVVQNVSYGKEYTPGAERCTNNSNLTFSNLFPRLTAL